MRRLLVFAAVVACCSCWQRPGLDVPDLASEHEEVAVTIARVARLGVTVDDELASLEQQTTAFFATPAGTWARPFPIDAFKHTAMSCLNSPYTQTEPDPVSREVADRFGIVCAVAAAVELDGRLANLPAHRTIASQKLTEIDAIRDVRVRLQARLRQLPSIVRRTRSYLTTRRAEARQMAKDAQARRSEYGRKSFGEAIADIESYEARLDELDAELQRLEASTQRWSEQLGAIVDLLYKELSRLGRT